MITMHSWRTYKQAGPGYASLLSMLLVAILLLDGFVSHKAFQSKVPFGGQNTLSAHTDLPAGLRHPPKSVAYRRHNSLLLSSNSDQSEDSTSFPQDAGKYTSKAFLQVMAMMTVAGAMLGPWLDGQHGAFGVLEYHQPFNLEIGESIILKTALWVPPLFGVAGFLIGFLYLYFDDFFKTDPGRTMPNGPHVLYGISFFAAQYYLSGLLAHGGVGLVPLHSMLALLAVAGFAAFDGTKAGLLVSLATAVGGPAIEIGLVNGFDMYHYTAADFYGIDSWIPWVYFLGGPAVGNLSRALWATCSRPPL